MSSTRPRRSHSTAWRALYPPTASPHSPEMPTTVPRSLIAVAAEVGSPASGGSSRIPLWRVSQMAARN